MNEEQTRKLVEETVMKILMERSNFTVPIHYHNNVDSPFVQLNGKILTSVFSADFGSNGDIYLYDVAGTRRIYAKINGTWRYVNLT